MWAYIENLISQDLKSLVEGTDRNYSDMILNDTTSLIQLFKKLDLLDFRLKQDEIKEYRPFLQKLLSTEMFDDIEIIYLFDLFMKCKNLGL